MKPIWVGLLGVALALGMLASPQPLEALPDPQEEWQQVQSANFLIYSNTKTKKTREIARELERFREVFLRLMPGLKGHAWAPTTVFVFNGREDFEPYMSSPPERDRVLAGQFIEDSVGNTVAINAYPRGGAALPVVYHEYIHNLVAENLGDVPLWLDEGLAEYFSTFKIVRGKIQIGRPIDRHISWLHGTSFIPLARLFEIDRESPEANDTEGLATIYAQSWLLVHYLLASGEVSSESASKLMELARSRKSAANAVRSALGIDTAALESRLRGYVRSATMPIFVLSLDELAAETELDVKTAERVEVLYQLGTLLAQLYKLSEDAEVGAVEHLRACLELGGQTADALASFAWLEERRGNADKAARLYAIARERGLEWWRSNVLYGNFVLKRLVDQPSGVDVTELERARESLRRAIEMEPDYGMPYAVLGATYLHTDGDPEEGIRALIRAQQILPNNSLVVFDLILLQLKAGNFKAGKGLIENDLVRMGDADLVASARRALIVEQNSRRVVLYNEALDLANSGKLEAARSQLVEMLKEVGDPGLDAAARRLLVQIEREIQH